MSIVAAVRHLETCLDSSQVKEVELLRSMDEALMRRLAAGTDLEYRPEFPRPYYRITKRKTYVIQGVLGNRTLRVTFSPGTSAAEEAELLELLERCAAEDGTA